MSEALNQGRGICRDRDWASVAVIKQRYFEPAQNE